MMVLARILKMVRRIVGAPSFSFARFDLTLDGNMKIRDAKSIWVVNYLQARISNDALKSFYRQQHAEYRARRKRISALVLEGQQ